MIFAEDIIAWLDPLRAAGNAKFIGGIGTMPQAIDQMKVDKSIFVLPPVRVAGPNEVSTGVIRQTITVHWRLLYAGRNIGNRWADQSKQIDLDMMAIEDRMLGWTKDRQIHSPAELQKSSQEDLTSMEAGTVLYSLDFSSREHKRKP